MCKLVWYWYCNMAMPMSNADIVRRGDHNVQLAGARTEAAIGREARLVRADLECIIYIVSAHMRASPF